MIIFFISEPRKPQAAPQKRMTSSLKSFDWKFWSFLVIMTIFAVGNSSDVFLIDTQGAKCRHTGGHDPGCLFVL
jgi:hypothetical protein